MRRPFGAGGEVDDAGEHRHSEHGEQVHRRQCRFEPPGRFRIARAGEVNVERSGDERRLQADREQRHRHPQRDDAVIGRRQRAQQDDVEREAEDAQRCLVERRDGIAVAREHGGEPRLRPADGTEV